MTSTPLTGLTDADLAMLRNQPTAYAVRNDRWLATIDTLREQLADAQQAAQVQGDNARLFYDQLKEAQNHESAWKDSARIALARAETAEPALMSERDAANHGRMEWFNKHNEAVAAAAALAQHCKTLLQEIQDLSHKGFAITQGHGAILEAVENPSKAALALLAEVASLRAAVEHYANDATWEQNSMDWNRGNVAREALARLTPKEPGE